MCFHFVSVFQGFFFPTKEVIIEVNHPPPPLPPAGAWLRSLGLNQLPTRLPAARPCPWPTARATRCPTSLRQQNRRGRGFTLELHRLWGGCVFCLE